MSTHRGRLGGTSIAVDSNSLHFPQKKVSTISVGNKNGCNVPYNDKLHKKDFDLRISEKTYLFSDHGIERRTKTPHRFFSCKNSQKLKGANKKQPQKEKIISSKAVKGLCGKCGRVYSDTILPVHSIQCSLLHGLASSTDDMYGTLDESKENLRIQLMKNPLSQEMSSFASLNTSPYGSTRYSFVPEKYAKTKKPPHINRFHAEESKTAHPHHPYRSDVIESPTNSFFGWQQIEWEKFQRLANQVEGPTIAVSDVPFLPPFATTFDFIGVDRISSKEKKRQNIRNAMMRWHPDKFFQAFGSKLHPNDKAEIMTKVKECFQRINATRDIVDFDYSLEVN
mmetsp:Transcript_2908/g.3403  ORF Transcript_2908/g.3403 Transcript_2908/m.3403 type:complete len:338 (+) Transcript_2908:155-1168(+)